MFLGQFLLSLEGMTKESVDHALWCVEEIQIADKCGDLSALEYWGASLFCDLANTNYSVRVCHDINNSLLLLFHIDDTKYEGVKIFYI